MGLQDVESSVGGRPVTARSLRLSERGNAWEPPGDRGSTYSVVTAAIALVFGVLALLELFEDDITTFEYAISCAILALSGLVVTLVALFGMSVAPWVGVIIVMLQAALAVYYIGFSDERQNAIMGLQKLPIMAMYFAWLYGARIARVCEMGILAAICCAAFLGPFGQRDGLFAPMNLFGAVAFTWLCLEMGIFIRRRLRVDADTDPLTGALNRRGFEDRAHTELRRAERHDRPVSVAVLDLDEFKAVNDGDGHAAGDDVLRSLVAQWTSLSREHDVVGRFGGDEFVMIMPETRLEEAAGLLRRLRDLAIHPWSWGAVEVLPGERLADALHRADQAMYTAKRDR